MRLGADMVRRCQMPMLGAGIAWMGMSGMGRREWDRRIGGVPFWFISLLLSMFNMFYIFLLGLLRTGDFAASTMGFAFVLVCVNFMILSVYRGAWLYTRGKSVRRYVEEGRRLAMRWEEISRKCGVEPIEAVKVIARWYVREVDTTAWIRNDILVRDLLGDLWDGRKEMSDDERKVFGCVVREWYPNSPPEGPGTINSLAGFIIPGFLILFAATFTVMWAKKLGYSPFPVEGELYVFSIGPLSWKIAVPLVSLILGYMAILVYRHYSGGWRNRRAMVLIFLPLIFPVAGFFVRLPAGLYPVEIIHALLFSAVSGITFSMVVSGLVMMDGWDGSIWSWLSGVGAFIAGMGWQVGGMLESAGFWVFGGLFKVGTDISQVGSLLLGHMVGGRGKEYPGRMMFIYCFIAMAIPSIIGYLTVGIADGLLW